jgi:hypothetical protein
MVGTPLGDHDHLPVVGAAALEHRERAVGRDMHDAPELVEQERPWRTGDWAAAYMSASARTVIIAASLGMSST